MAALHGANVALAEAAVKGRPALVLDGAAAQVVVDLLGGSIVNFHLRDQGVNPLSWGRERAGEGPQSMGHFLCLDRWASVSEAEAKNGMPGHGEASAVRWWVVRGPEERGGFIEAEMAATLPLAAFLFAIPPDYAGTERVALIDGRLIVRPRGTTGNRAKAIEAAAGEVERTDADLEMEIDALFIE